MSQHFSCEMPARVVITFVAVQMIRSLNACKKSNFCATSFPLLWIAEGDVMLYILISLYFWQTPAESQSPTKLTLLMSLHGSCRKGYRFSRLVTSINSKTASSFLYTRRQLCCTLFRFQNPGKPHFLFSSNNFLTAGASILSMHSLN